MFVLTDSTPRLKSHQARNKRSPLLTDSNGHRCAWLTETKLKLNAPTTTYESLFIRSSAAFTLPWHRAAGRLSAIEISCRTCLRGGLLCPRSRNLQWHRESWAAASRIALGRVSHCRYALAFSGCHANCRQYEVRTGPKAPRRANSH